MTSMCIVSHLAHLPQRVQALCRALQCAPRPNLHYLAEHHAHLPDFVQESAVAQRYLDLLGPLDWEHFPDRKPEARGLPAVPYAAFCAACLMKLDQRLVYMSQLRQYLIEQPVLIWLFGFRLKRSPRYRWGFDASASLPTVRHFTYMLRDLPNAVLQFLLDSSVDLLKAELNGNQPALGECISLDTKHIVAWVRENNPKTYIKGKRYDKTQQPAGDPDCRLGCKRRRNQRASSKEPPATPHDNPLPADTIAVGEYYWGYSSGIVATKLPHWGEFVLAERTQPFDQPDVSYFQPLMADTQRRLGFRPKYGAFDAAFDAFYVYEHFHSDQPAGFAAVPFSQRGGHGRRQFSPDGLPLCEAGLPMPIKLRFTNRSGLIEHECARHACPLLFPQPTQQTCPIQHKRWSKGGCVTTLPTSIGARIRHQLDRDSDAYKTVYKQRSATERINSQAKDLGIERPKLRNGPAIANLNTLIYVLINLRALQRVRQRIAALPT